MKLATTTILFTMLLLLATSGDAKCGGTCWCRRGSVSVSVSSPDEAYDALRLACVAKNKCYSGCCCRCDISRMCCSHRDGKWLCKATCKKQLPVTCTYCRFFDGGLDTDAKFSTMVDAPAEK